MKLQPAVLVRILCLLLILPIVTACDQIQKMYESRNDDQLAKAKRWPAKSLPPIGVRCNLSTSWREGKIYFIFDAAPLIDPKEAMNTENKPEEFVRNALMSRNFSRSLENRTALPDLTVTLTDSDGFEIMSIEMNETKRIVDNDGKPESLQQKSNMECSRKKYQDMSDWDVGWRRSSR